jgi:hypothetical protein
MTREVSQTLTIKVGAYLWEVGIPVPDCDSCGNPKPDYKVYVPDVGIRLCKKCLIQLQREINKMGLK